MSRHYRARRPEPRQKPVTTYSVCDNGSHVGCYPNNEDAARAMAICAARHTGYGAYSVQSGGQVHHVERFRRGDKDGHVYGYKYDATKYCDAPYVAAPAGMVLP